MMAEVVEQVGAPDILVNNAAVTFLRPLDEFPRQAGAADARDARARPAAPHAARPPCHARARAGVGADDDVGRRRSHRGPTVLRVRPHSRVRHVRHGEGGDEPDGAEPRGRAPRRRHRGQRRRAVEAGGDTGRGHARPGQGGHGRHRAHHRDRLRASAPATPPPSPAASSTPSRSCARSAFSRPNGRSRGGVRAAPGRRRRGCATARLSPVARTRRRRSRPHGAAAACRPSCSRASAALP